MRQIDFNSGLHPNEPPQMIFLIRIFYDSLGQNQQIWLSQSQLLKKNLQRSKNIICILLEVNLSILFI